MIPHIENDVKYRAVYTHDAMKEYAFQSYEFASYWRDIANEIYVMNASDWKIVQHDNGECFLTSMTAGEAFTKADYLMVSYMIQEGMLVVSRR